MCFISSPKTTFCRHSKFQRSPNLHGWTGGKKGSKNVQEEKALKIISQFFVFDDIFGISFIYSIIPDYGTFIPIIGYRKITTMGQDFVRYPALIIDEYTKVSKWGHCLDKGFLMKFQGDDHKIHNGTVDSTELNGRDFQVSEFHLFFLLRFFQKRKLI